MKESSLYLQIKQKKKRGIRFRRGYCHNNIISPLILN